MSLWYFYDVRTGLYAGRSFEGTVRELANNRPRNVLAFELGASVDPRTKAMDLATRKLVSVNPPAPKVPAEDIVRRRVARRKIHQLERKQQRPLRELSLGKEGARERVEALESQIEELRKDVNG